MRNGILLSKLFRPTLRKKHLKSFSRSLEQFVWNSERSGQFLVFNRMFFYLVPGGFSDLINQDNFNSNWKKLLGFKNLQEKLEKYLS